MYDKIYSDFHLHTKYSSDCSSDINEIIKTAKKKGLNMLCLTDHNDLDFPDVPDHIKFDLDTDNYINHILRLRERFLPDFDLRCGVEQGLMRSTCEKLNNFSKEHPGIDFIICSSHLVDNKDPYYLETFLNPDGSKKDPMTIYKHYFEDILYVVTHFNDYNVYGHIDYIFRYGPERITSDIFEKKYYPVFSELFEEILKNIIKNGKGIEINTGSLYRGMDFPHPHSLILKLYKELGGEILTIGSDAHDYEHIGYGFEDAKELAKTHGFKTFCTFKDMQPEFHPL